MHQQRVGLHTFDDEAGVVGQALRFDRAGELRAGHCQ
jgi:hypothetical protein